MQTEIKVGDSVRGVADQTLIHSDRVYRVLALMEQACVLQNEQGFFIHNVPVACVEKVKG